MTPRDRLALRWEPVPWKRDESQHLSRRQRVTTAGSYDAAVVPRIADMTFDIDPQTAAEADDARDAIARFDAELSGMFPEGAFAPLSSVLLRTESASSSQIENITTGARALALAEIGYAQCGSNADLVAANVDAITRAIELARQVTPQAILDIHEALMRGQVRAKPGQFRTEQVWIGNTPTPHGATFVPPHHAGVPEAIADLCVFTDRTDLPLLTHAAIAHAQFETIHAFNDGNGRTGRALVHALLKAGGATTRTTLPVSAGLLQDTGSYFDALTAYRKGDPNPIVSRFSLASFAAVTNGRKLAEDLITLRDRWLTDIRARRNAAVWRALPVLISQPAVTSKTVQERLRVSQPTADAVLHQLVATGVVEPANAARRNVVYVAKGVTEALDEFAARARRRP